MIVFFVPLFVVVFGVLAIAIAAVCVAAPILTPFVLWTFWCICSRTWRAAKQVMSGLALMEQDREALHQERRRGGRTYDPMYHPNMPDSLQ